MIKLFAAGATNNPNGGILCTTGNNLSERQLEDFKHLGSHQLPGVGIVHCVALEKHCQAVAGGIEIVGVVFVDPAADSTNMI